MARSERGDPSLDDGHRGQGMLEMHGLHVAAGGHLADARQGSFVACGQNRRRGRNACRGRDGRVLGRAGAWWRLVGGLGRFQVGLHYSCWPALFMRGGPCLLFSNIQQNFQFFNYLPNVFKHENTKYLLIEVQNFQNLVEHYFKWNKLTFCPNFQISIDFEL
jgi:hypothetical protein